jgi:carboxyl-terminal processing protease
MNPFRTYTIALACALAAFAGGLWLGGHPDQLPSGLRDVFVEDEATRLRAELIDAIEDGFYKEVDPDELEDASLDGIVRALDDRYSHYFDPGETETFEQSISGQFEGVGMSIEEDKRGLLVLNVFDGSPAAKAGIRKGDVVTAVNGDSIAGESADIATAKIKGRAGTSVELTLLVGGKGGRKRTVSVDRARIDVPVVEGKLVEENGVDLGVVQLLTFSSGAHGALREEIDSLLADGAEGIVLDLRGNGGGLLQEAVLVSSLFVEDGEIVTTKGRTKAERLFEAQGDAIDPDVPVVVLVDKGSASASEIVTGALRDRGRAEIVGENTFGKGVFQEVQPLSNGGTLDLTVGSYFLPGGEDISDKGIKPDVKARDKPRTKPDEALPTALDELTDEIE